MLYEIVGRLTVIAPLPRRNGQKMWAASCECGYIIKVLEYNLKKKNGTRSCGCLQKEIHRARITKHRLCESKTYSIWEAMIQRTLNPKCPAYKHYGARGISVAHEWMCFEGFYADMGDQPPGLTLDRVDNDKGYSKNNCRWVTQEAQCRNTRRTRLTEQLVRYLRVLDKSQFKEELQKLMQQGISEAAIRHARSGRTWANVK